MLKISTRISLLYFIATAIIIAVMAVAMYFIYYNQSLRAIDDELHDYVHFLTSGQNFESSDLESIFKELTARRSKSKNKLKFDYNFILVGQDSVVYQSDERFNLDEIIKKIMEFDESKSKKDFATLSVDGNKFRIYEDKLHKHNKKGELDIIMVASLEKFSESLTQITYILFIISPVLLLIAALIGYFITYRALNPVRHIIRTARTITGKNLQGRVPIPVADDELAELARTLNEMIDRLEQTIKSQKQFIADASHDFRTPLTIIHLELELLLEKQDIGEDVRNSIEKSIREIKSLSTMAENLLILARADAHQLTINKIPFRFDELIIEAVSGFNKIALSSNIKFRIDVASSVGINADKGLIKRLLNNALDNALKYSDENSTIEINLSDDDTSVTLEISSYGRTLSKQEANQIFNRFQRMEKSRTTKGYGLGMPIIKTIVQAHNGSVNFISEKGKNRVKISFPK